MHASFITFPCRDLHSLQSTRNLLFRFCFFHFYLRALSSISLLHFRGNWCDSNSHLHSRFWICGCKSGSRLAFRLALVFWTHFSFVGLWAPFTVNSRTRLPRMNHRHRTASHTKRTLSNFHSNWLFPNNVRQSHASLQNFILFLFSFSFSLSLPPSCMFSLLYSRGVYC